MTIQVKFSLEYDVTRQYADYLHICESEGDKPLGVEAWAKQAFEGADWNNQKIEESMVVIAPIDILTR